MKTFEQIMKMAGGIPAVGKACKDAGYNSGYNAVYRWSVIGVPDKYWPLIIEMAKDNGNIVTAKDLMEANSAFRKSGKLSDKRRRK